MRILFERIRVDGIAFCFSEHRNRLQREGMLAGFRRLSRDGSTENHAHHAGDSHLHLSPRSGLFRPRRLAGRRDFGVRARCCFGRKNVSTPGHHGRNRGNLPRYLPLSVACANHMRKTLKVLRR